jgi:hypothetical protein
MRQVVGYDRFIGEHASAATHGTLSSAATVPSIAAEPSMKLQAKQRDGKKVRYVYDPAKTPLQRLLLSGVLATQKQQELLEVAHALDPMHLFEQVERLQQAVFRCAADCSPFVSSLPSTPIRVFSVEQCTTEKLPVKGSVPDPSLHLRNMGGAMAR